MYSLAEILALAVYYLVGQFDAGASRSAGIEKEYRSLAGIDEQQRRGREETRAA